MLKFGDWFNFSEDKCLAFYNGKREGGYWLQTVGERCILREVDWNGRSGTRREGAHLYGKAACVGCSEWESRWGKENIYRV